MFACAPLVLPVESAPPPPGSSPPLLCRSAAAATTRASGRVDGTRRWIKTAGNRARLGPLSAIPSRPLVGMGCLGARMGWRRGGLSTWSRGEVWCGGDVRATPGHGDLANLPRGPRSQRRCQTRPCHGDVVVTLHPATGSPLLGTVFSGRCIRDGVFGTFHGDAAFLADLATRSPEAPGAPRSGSRDRHLAAKDLGTRT